MFKQLLYFSTLLFLSCSNSPSDNKNPSSTKSKPQLNQVTLSHVKAYLLLGDVEKAEQLLHKIKPAKPNAQTMLIMAELHAAKGNSFDAQRVFLLALTDSLYDTPLDKKDVPANLLEYFCSEKKWPATEGYASALVGRFTDGETQNLGPSDIQLKNNGLAQIGLCFFNEQKFEQAQKWLQKLNFIQPTNPQAHLALARIAIENNQLLAAQESIKRYESTKSNIDAKMLWTAFEVYQALNQPEIAAQVGEHLYSLFPHNEYTRKYILNKKRGQRTKRQQQEIAAMAKTNNSSTDEVLPTPPLEQATHIIKKGETLYQLSRRYDVSITDLLKWNPDLIVNNIALGTPIRLFAD